MLYVAGFCDCEDGFAGDKCEVKVDIPPSVETVNTTQCVTTDTTSSCQTATIYGKFGTASAWCELTRMVVSELFLVYCM